MTCNWDKRTLKINQSAFIRDLLKEKNLTDNNAVNIPMKAGNFIKMLENDNYEETDLKIY